MEDAQILRTEVEAFGIVDNQIKELNARLTAAREQRSLIKDRIAVILSAPQFVGYDKLSVNSDKSTIKIKRPMQWEKPWSLSRNSLLEYLRTYFQGDQRPTYRACYDFIVNMNTKMSNEFSLERTT